VETIGLVSAANTYGGKKVCCSAVRQARIVGGDGVAIVVLVVVVSAVIEWILLYWWRVHWW
jgi:hypothetical protein